MTSNLDIIKAAKKPRVWFYKPSWDWCGLSGFLPFGTGHDEYSRECITLGWPLTGQLVIPTKYCDYDECYAQTVEYLEFLRDENLD
jgi:hypothetical protein